MSHIFQKMWEAADTYVFDIDTGSILPITQSLPKVSSFADKKWFYHYENGIGAAYYEEGEMKKAAEAGLKDFSDPNYQKKYFSDIKELLSYETALYQKIEATNFKDLSDSELKNVFQESVDVVVKNFGYYLACQPQCVSLIEKRAQEGLAEVVPDHLVRDAFTLLSTPTSETKIRREEKDWLSLLDNIRNASQEEISKAVRRHCKEYFLLNAADGHEPWTLEYFENKYKQDSKISVEETREKISLLDKSLEDIKRAKTEFIASYQIPQNVLRDCDLLAEIGHWRLEMRFVWMPGYYYDKIILKEIARRFSFDGKLIRFATISEILGLFEGKSMDVQELEKRSQIFLFVIDGNKTKVISGDEAKNEFNKLVPPAGSASTKEFKGNVAMKGIVRAKALVFRWTDDMKKKLAAADGDFILVAGQTRPQLMPLIVKSKGIVTDEGGITSHAAIVSRELKIPCVIGTKVATQVLKDGDMIELDADTGIVRKIS